MVVKVYISGISGNKEVKKRQQRVLLILDSKIVKYELLDIAEPNMEEAKEYMQNNSKMNGGTISDPNPRHPLPPQIFNDEEYCGDYDAFDMANEIDEMEKFLKLPEDQIPTSHAEIKLGNGELLSGGKSKKASPEKETDVKENGKGDESVSKEEDESEKIPKEKSPSPQKEKSPSPEKEASPSPEKKKSPSPQKEKSPSPQKEKSPSPQKEKSPSPQKEKSPSPQKENSPSPQKEKSPSPPKEKEEAATGDGDNETDDQKAENVDNETEEETAKGTEETEKSDEA